MKKRSICLLTFTICSLLYSGTDDHVSKRNAIASFRQDEFILDTSVTTIPGYGNQLTPVVASDGTNFLLVWAEFRNLKLQIFGARMDQNGVLLDTLAIPIATKAETQYAPAVVFGGSYYFVVWKGFYQYFDESFGYSYHYMIYGTRVSLDGIIMDTTAIQITPFESPFWWGQSNRPQVAFDGINYFVVWIGDHSIIYGARVDQSGNVLDYPFPVSTVNNQFYDAELDVAFGGQYYNVVWERRFQWNGWNNDSSTIYCARVTTNGSLVDTNAIVVAHGKQTTRNPMIASSGQDFLVVWEEKVSEVDTTNTNIYGVRVTQSGVVLDTTGIPICTARNLQRTPAIDFDGMNYFVVWKDNRNSFGLNRGDIYGARVSPSGIVLDTIALGIAIETTTAACNIDCYPAVVFGGGYHLVTWQHGTPGKPVCYDINAIRVSPAGAIIDTSSFSVLTQVPGHQYSSVSAFDGTNYLVAWNDYHYGYMDTFAWWSSSDYSDIYGMRVSGTGVVLDNAAIKIASGPSEEVNPSMGFDGVNYLVAWEDDSVAQYYYEPGMIKGSRISPGGAVLDSGGFAITEPNGYRMPVIGFDGANYLIVYFNYNGSSLLGKRITPTGIVIDTQNIEIAFNQDCEVLGDRPHIAFDGTNYLIVWTWQLYYDWPTIYGIRFSPSGVVVDTTPIVISHIHRMRWWPAIAYDGVNYLVVWEDWRNQYGFNNHCDIYGARVDVTGIVLDTGGIPISTSYFDQECPNIGFDGTNYVVVWQDLRDTMSYNIYGAKVSPAGNVINTYQVVAEPYDQIEPTITRGNNDQMLITYTGWTSMINSHRAHTMRIWGKMYPFPGVEEGSGMPASGRVLRLNAYPNPCRERIEIKWTIPRTNEHLANKDDRKLMIYDITGRVVKDLSRLLAPNNNLYQTTWDMTDDVGRRLPAGVYFVRLEIPGKELVEKVVLIK
ncbi:MAG TPA: T9SS type A sorting domain-containing protein [bacterium]